MSVLVLNRRSTSTTQVAQAATPSWTVTSTATRTRWEVLHGNWTSSSRPSSGPSTHKKAQQNNYFASIAYTRIISADMLNEFRITAQRNYSLTAKPAASLPSPSALGFGVTPDFPTGPPALSFDSGLDLGFNYVGPTTGANNTYSYSDALTWVKGRNTWKFGGGFSAYQNNELYDFYGNGIFSFAALPESALATALPIFCSESPLTFFKGRTLQVTSEVKLPTDSCRTNGAQKEP